MSKKMKSNLLLLLTTVIWGTAFVAQKSGADIGNFTFGGIRTFIGGLVLIPVILLMNGGKKESTAKTDEKMNLIGGVACGVALFIASTLQQFGVSMTSVSKSGFLTTLYVVFVPLISIFLRKKIRPVMWLCVGLGIAGFYLLCLYGETLTIETGDLLVLLCSVMFAVHILVVDYFVPKCDGVIMSCIQFLTAGLIGIICMFIFEEPVLKDILSNWIPIVYAGVLSCGMGYTFQIIGQKHAEPTQASLILCLESVFAAIAGAILLSERLTLIQYAGCIIIFAASIISNLPEKKKA